MRKRRLETSFGASPHTRTTLRRLSPAARPRSGRRPQPPETGLRDRRSDATEKGARPGRAGTGALLRAYFALRLLRLRS